MPMFTNAEATLSELLTANVRPVKQS